MTVRDALRAAHAATLAVFLGCGFTSCAGRGDAATSAAEDAAASRPAGGTNRAFRPLDLPPPNDLRAASGAPGPDYWQQEADYVIDATLDADLRVVAGRATITYKNRSPEALPYLWLHLEQNLYRSTSVGRAVFGDAGRYGHAPGFEGGAALKSVTAAGKPLSFRVYDTLARVDLPSPVAPRDGSVVFEVAWSFPIPAEGTDRLGRETVADGEIFQLAQWFPAVVKFDDVRGWNALPYLGAGEFYTDFGSYDVRLTVPRAHLVAATGELQNPDEVLTRTQRARLDQAAKSRATTPVVAVEEIGRPGSRPGGDGPVTWKFKAERCRTFAWASSAAFAWDACATGGVLCQSFYPREAAATWGGPAGSSDMLAFSLEHYGAKWIAYPYRTATNVNGVVGGMEYPSIVFCSERADSYELWLVTTHEIGHTWFPMLVNTDERRHAWMDEGFNTFLNWYACLARYPDRADDGPFKGLTPGWFEKDKYLAHLRSARRPPCDTPPDRMRSSDVGNTQYATPAVGLVLLREEILGPERFDVAFREYCRRWAYKSPQPADFFRTMENAAGADLAWFFRGWFLESATMDQAVVGASLVLEPDGSGLAEVTVENRGDLPMPILWRVVYDDGSEETRSVPVDVWAASTRREVSWSFDASRRPVRFTLDPEARLPDVDRSNDAIDLRIR